MSAFCVVGSIHAASSSPAKPAEFRGLNSKALTLMTVAASGAAYKISGDRLNLLAAAALPSAVEAASEWPLKTGSHLVKGIRQSLELKATGDTTVTTVPKNLQDAKKKAMGKRAANLAINGAGAGLGWYVLSKVLGQERATALVCGTVVVVGAASAVKRAVDGHNDDQALMSFVAKKDAAALSGEGSH